MGCWGGGEDGCFGAGEVGWGENRVHRGSAAGRGSRQCCLQRGGHRVRSTRPEWAGIGRWAPLVLLVLMRPAWCVVSSLGNKQFWIRSESLKVGSSPIFISLSHLGRIQQELSEGKRALGPKFVHPNPTTPSSPTIQNHSLFLVSSSSESPHEILLALQVYIYQHHTASISYSYTYAIHAHIKSPH